MAAETANDSLKTTPLREAGQSSSGKVRPREILTDVFACVDRYAHDALQITSRQFRGVSIDIADKGDCRRGVGRAWWRVQDGRILVGAKVKERFVRVKSFDDQVQAEAARSFFDLLRYANVEQVEIGYSCWLPETVTIAEDGFKHMKANVLRAVHDQLNGTDERLHFFTTSVAPIVTNVGFMVSQCAGCKSFRGDRIIQERDERFYVARHCGSCAANQL